MICIVLLNEVPAAHSALAAKLTPDWLALTATDLQTQLTAHVAPFWPLAKGATVRVGSGPSDVGAHEIPFRILAKLPDAPGAIAYHDVASGTPDAFLGLDTCTTLADVATALSHENVEIVGDPTCDAWEPLPGGKQIALELCDPVQERAYSGEGGTQLSDFVLPSFFNAALPAPRTFMALMGLADDIASDVIAPGGYEIQRNADGSGETQVFGAVKVNRFRRVMAKSSRAYRRGVRV